ncbi:MAG: PAS domain S-box protein [Candidatus Hydrogenedentes bacterium]|nr:PAS domain S-box protein [Candidatus Hydrogenedentota bacterium]
MKRTGTLTVPYTFCLFCGVIGLVLLMTGTFAWQAWRDIREAEPDLATRALHAAIAPVTQALAQHFDEPVQQLGLIRQWSKSGLIPESSPAQWPSLLIPALTATNGLNAIYLVRENGAACEVVRTAAGWTGRAADPGNLDAALTGMAWDPEGQRVSDGERGEALADFRRADWYQQAMAMRDEGATSSLAAELGATSMTLAAPLIFPGGHRGCVALDLDTTFLAGATGSVGSAFELTIDPGGTRLGQIQDEQVLALLQERAVPGASSPALTQLFPFQAREASYWYAARSYALDESQVWWVIARVEPSALPLPTLPVFAYVLWALAAGVAGAIPLALAFGRHITRPLRQVAARARGIHVIDEHYLPWPRSRFTEVNVLTSALEEIYDAAVEHLDYHDAPLVAWAEPELSAEDGMIDADAVRHVFQFPRGNVAPVSPLQPDGAVIDVTGDIERVALPEAIPAAQLQVLHGTRKELRRLQSQLAGASEELRTADNHHQQDRARIKRQRNCLRSLEHLLLAEGAASPAMLAQVQEVLGATRISLWTAGREAAHFHLTASRGGSRGGAPALVASFNLMALLQSESLVAVQDPARDPRLAPLSSHPGFRSSDGPRLLVPIRLAGKLLAFLVAERPASHGRWKVDEELFALGVANACAGVLWHQMRNRTAAASPAFAAQIVVQGQGPRRENGKARKNGAAHRSTSSAAVLYWAIDRAGCIKSLDGDVEGLYGRSRDQLIGQPITFLSGRPQGQRDMERLAALLAGQRCGGYETCHVAADGTAIQLAVHAKVWRDAGDRIVGARGTLTPVSAAVSG